MEMTNKLLPCALLALGMLAACAPEVKKPVENKTTANEAEIIVPPAHETNVANASEEAPGVGVNLAPDELTLVLPNGSSRHMSFGMAKADAVKMLTAALGSPIEQAENQDCGAGSLGYAAFRDGLSLYFQDGKFAGWDLDGRENGKFTTGNGIGIGMTRKALEAAGPVEVGETTIGQEFTLGDMSGLLSSAAPDGKVTNLWAGVTCIAR
jgi:opacity protein-like surface antigen